MRRSAMPGAAFLAALLVAGSLSILAGSPPELVAQTRRELRVGLPGVPATLDPTVAVEGATPLIARQVFEGLVTYRTGTTDIEPALATGWSVSRNGLVWTFTVREHVQFHDGTPLAPAEVVASFDRHLRPDAAGRSPVWAALLRGVPGIVRDVRVGEGRTVQIVLAQPYGPLLTVLAHPGLAVARAAWGGDGVPRLVGTGPFRLVDASPGRLALEAAPGHRGGGPRSERLVFLDIADDGQAAVELAAQAIDVWLPPTPPAASAGALSVTGTRVGYLAFQTEKEPFSAKRVRQAVAAAVDPAVVAAAVEPEAVPLQSFLPPGIWARREGSPILGGTRETVKRLLAAGGWQPDFRSGLLFAEDGSPALRRLAGALQLMLAAADIAVELHPRPADVVRSALQSGEHEMALVEADIPGGDPHHVLFPLSTSEGALKGPRARNFSFYRDPRVDDVLIRASQLTFRPERARLYQRAQALLADELPWIPLYVRLRWAVVRPEVRGLRLHPTGFHSLTTVGLD